MEGDARPGGVDLNLYRVLCLTALGRSEEADRVIEAIVSADPLFQPDDEMAPRIVPPSAPSGGGCRQRLRVRSMPRARPPSTAKSSRKPLRKLERAVAIIAHPDLAGVSELEDLRTLATGFLDLSRVALKNAQPAAPPAVPAAAVPATAVPAAAAVPSLISSPARGATVVPLTEPVAIRQEMPKWNTSVAGPLSKGNSTASWKSRSMNAAASLQQASSTAFAPVR